MESKGLDMGGLLRKLLEAVSHAETLGSIVHTEFVRTYLVPVVMAAMSGTAGIMGGVPFMWIIMASAVTFWAVAFALFVVDVLRERKSPQNKLTQRPVFQCDLNTATVPIAGNRKQRLAQQAQRQPAQSISPTQVHPLVPRTLYRGQIGIELANNALFPISCILSSAETEITGQRPPRSIFPKQPAIIPPGGIFRFMDDPIELDDMPCQRLSGRINMLVKYGLPENERF
jgi:hypothetical protein